MTPRMQGHRSSDCEHDKREGSSGERLILNLSQRADLRDGERGVEAPDSLLDFHREGLRSGAAAADGEGGIAANLEVVVPQLGHNHWKISHFRCWLGHAVIAAIADYADDFAPGSAGTFADAFADCARRIVPQLTGEVLGEDDDGRLLISVGPVEVAAGDDAISESGKESGGGVFVLTHGR